MRYRLRKIINEVLFLVSVWVIHVREWLAAKSGRASNTLRLDFVVEEFFHKDLRGFGGFGITVKNITDYFHQNANGVISRVLLPLKSQMVGRPELRRFHNADVILRPATAGLGPVHFFGYSRLGRTPDRRVFLTIEYYPSYEYALMSSPATPVIIWIRDPRDQAEWGKIATCDLAVKARGGEDVSLLAVEKAYSMKKLRKYSRLINRKIIFAVNGMFLLERARNTYGLPALNPHVLFNPIPLGERHAPEFSRRPSILFLGRLDPVKRPWIVFELARRFPQVDFNMAGSVHFRDLMDPVLEQYKGVSNIKLLGHIDGQRKEQLLRECWGLINTSIHEGYPVSFQEAFARGKCVVSCHNPENTAEKFGYYTGEILGDGLDAQAIDIYSQKLEQLLSRTDERIAKGKAAQDFVYENHSFERFKTRLQEILEKEGIE